MSRLLTISAIAACYFVFAILLNSVGTVILQSINSFDISKPDASTLEGFKDLSIALVSFVVASFIPRIGYKHALLFGLTIVTLACLSAPMLASFWAIKLLFACIGASFAFVKVAVYSIVGQLSDGTRAHSALLNTVEGIFMLGVLSGYWVFSAFIDPQNPASLEWLNVYYVLAGISATTAVLVLFAPIKKGQTATENSATEAFVEMLRLTYQPLVLIFVISIFFYVLIEQGIGTWLPTFNSEVLQLPLDVSVQITSIFAAALALGRLLAGQLLRYISWYRFLNTSLLLMAIIMLLALPMSSGVQGQEVNSFFEAPLAAYLLPLVGLMMAPIYPIINSVMLSALDKSQHAAMTGLIVVFSALGGTTGSIITGLVFDRFGGQQAFYLSIIPMILIAASLHLFRRTSNRMQGVAYSE